MSERDCSDRIRSRDDGQRGVARVARAHHQQITGHRNRAAEGQGDPQRPLGAARYSGHDRYSGHGRDDAGQRAPAQLPSAQHRPGFGEDRRRADEQRRNRDARRTAATRSRLRNGAPAPDRPSAAPIRLDTSSPICSRSGLTAGSSAISAVPHAAVNSGSSATTTAMSRSVALTRILVVSLTSVCSGSACRKRRYTAVTSALFDGKYVYALAGDTPARLATARIVRLAYDDSRSSSRPASRTLRMVCPGRRSDRRAPRAPASCLAGGATSLDTRRV